MSKGQNNNAVSSGALSSKSIITEGRRGKFKPQKLGKFVKGNLEWHNYVTDEERQMIVDELVNVIVHPTRSDHHRLQELIWFARQLESAIYKNSTSKEVYFLSIQTRIPFLETALKKNKTWMMMLDNGDIPCTDTLEQLFCTKSERLPYVDPEDDEELNAEGGTVINLITKEQFNHNHCKINVRSGRKIIEPERRKPRAQAGQQNRKILAARYANKDIAEGNVMTIHYEQPSP